MFHTFTEPLFLKPDGERTRYPIGWNGYGRYIPGSLKVTYNGLPCNITEERNGIWYNFSVAPGANTNYNDYTVEFTVRPLDYAFSIGEVEGGYEGEKYFLFPNWNEASGQGDAFWVGKYQTSRNNDGDAMCVSYSGGYWNLPYNQAYNTCRLKGPRFHLFNNKEWVSIALWTAHHNINVKGNIFGIDGANLDGDNSLINDMYGYQATYSSKKYWVVTGDVPVTWNHNGMQNGIKNLVGNLNEIVYGLYIVKGSLNILDENFQYYDTGIDIANTGTASKQIIDIHNETKDILDNGVPDSISTDGFIPPNLNEGYIHVNTTQSACVVRGGNMTLGTKCNIWSTDAIITNGDTAANLTSFRICRYLDPEEFTDAREL